MQGAGLAIPLCVQAYGFVKHIRNACLRRLSF
jgi:hypothetical protein